ncbi:serine-rich adhesin for platelets-like isoform X2 [Xenia sp. Carnegie-2017]|uniref:serine-rich adhesin for platelets-like isoform X2 n=1 Tax=Xenia sp. Carnegie-2017 TaxID=2897299 RepID=UPI001F037F7E|nr:serine-rich adhesin for platelets-like isoform X2 [Xenia sp. Carnegie-2017]
MRRRFKPALVESYCDKRGNSKTETVSNERRRARFKPKVAILSSSQKVTSQSSRKSLQSNQKENETHENSSTAAKSVSSTVVPSSNGQQPLCDIATKLQHDKDNFCKNIDDVCETVAGINSQPISHGSLSVDSAAGSPTNQLAVAKQHDASSSTMYTVSNHFPKTTMSNIQNTEGFDLTQTGSNSKVSSHREEIHAHVEDNTSLNNQNSTDFADEDEIAPNPLHVSSPLVSNQISERISNNGMLSLATLTKYDRPSVNHKSSNQLTRREHIKPKVSLQTKMSRISDNVPTPLVCNNTSISQSENVSTLLSPRTACISSQSSEDTVFLSSTTNVCTSSSNNDPSIEVSNLPTSSIDVSIPPSSKNSLHNLSSNNTVSLSVLDSNTPPSSSNSQSTVQSLSDTATLLSSNISRTHPSSKDPSTLPSPSNTSALPLSKIAPIIPSSNSQSAFESSSNTAALLSRSISPTPPPSINPSSLQSSSRVSSKKFQDDLEIRATQDDTNRAIQSFEAANGISSFSGNKSTRCESLSINCKSSRLEAESHVKVASPLVRRARFKPKVGVPKVTSNAATEKVSQKLVGLRRNNFPSTDTVHRIDDSNTSAESPVTSQSIDSTPLNCPPLVEDRTIVFQPMDTEEDGKEANDDSNLCYLVNADDLLNTILNEVTIHSVDQSSNTLEDGSMDISAAVVHRDDIVSTGMKSYQSTVEGTLNETSDQMSNFVDESRNVDTRASCSKQSVSQSGLVIKRRRAGKRKKPPTFAEETVVFDISSLPIATNIEVEPELTGQLDHPLLELPEDLIKEDTGNCSKNSRESSGTSSTLKQRARKRYTDTRKVVLSRNKNQASRLVEATVSCGKDDAVRLGQKTSIHSSGSVSSDAVRLEEITSVESIGNLEDGMDDLRMTTKTIPTLGNNDITSARENCEMASSGDRGCTSSRAICVSEPQNNATVDNSSCQNLRRRTRVVPRIQIGRKSKVSKNQKAQNAAVAHSDRTDHDSFTTNTIPDGTLNVETGQADSDLSGTASAVLNADVRGASTDLNWNNEIPAQTTKALSPFRVSNGTTNDNSAVSSSATNSKCPSPFSGAVVNAEEKSFEMLSGIDENGGPSNESHNVASVLSFGNDHTSGEKSMRHETTDEPPVSGVVTLQSPILGLSLGISESTIEDSIRSTLESLPNTNECQECPDLVPSLKTVGDNMLQQRVGTSLTQPGTLEDNVARTVRRLSQEALIEGSPQTLPEDDRTAGIGNDGENDETFSSRVASGKRRKEQASSNKELKKSNTPRSKLKPKPTLQRKQKCQGKDRESINAGKVVGDSSLVQNGTSDDVNDLNRTLQDSSTCMNEPVPNTCGQIQTSCLSENTLQNNFVPQDNVEEWVESGCPSNSCVQLDTSVADTILRNSLIENSLMTQESTVITHEIVSNYDPDVSTQETSTSKSKKGKGKTPKPKVPRKRGRKPANAKDNESCNQTDQGNNEETRESGTSGTATTPTVDNRHGTTASQKRPRGRPRSSNKTPNPNLQNNTAPTVGRPRKRKRKEQYEVREDGEVDVAKMKISDMIYYNPLTNPMNFADENETPTSFFAGGASAESRQSETVLPAVETDSNENRGEASKATVCAPQVRIDADGNIVLDEESMVIDSTPVQDNLQGEVVFENADQQYNALKRRKNIERWTKKETLYFYEVLTQVGTDFSLMAKLFPKRNRTELKAKEYQFQPTYSPTAWRKQRKRCSEILWILKRLTL